MMYDYYMLYESMLREADGEDTQPEKEVKPDQGNNQKGETQGQNTNTQEAPKQTQQNDTKAQQEALKKNKELLKQILGLAGGNFKRVDIEFVRSKVKNVFDAFNEVKQISDDQLVERATNISIEVIQKGDANFANIKDAVKFVAAVAKGLKIGDFTPSLRDRIAANFALLGLFTQALTIEALIDMVEFAKKVQTESFIFVTILSNAFRGVKNLAIRLMKSSPVLTLIGIFSLIESTKILKLLANAIGQIPIGNVILTRDVAEVFGNLEFNVKLAAKQQNSPTLLRLFNMMISGLNRLKAVLASIKAFVVSLFKSQSESVILQEGLVGSLLKKVLAIGGVSVALAIAFKMISEATGTNLLEKLAKTKSPLQPMFQKLLEIYNRIDALINKAAKETQ